MHRSISLVVLTALVLTSLAWGQGVQPPAILDKAIKATGGEEKLTRLQGYAFKLKGIHYGDNNQKLPFTAIVLSQGPEKGVLLQEIEAMGGKSFDLTVINGKEGWTKTGKGEARPLSADDLHEEKENLYFNWIGTLVPLKGKDFKLTPLDEIKVEGRAAAGFTVVCKGHYDVKFWFDKETGLLAKSERKIKDGREEMVFTTYKDVDGIKLPTKVSVKLDGQPHYEYEVTEARVQDRLDEKMFAKP
jgi:hypothetical protein